MKVNKFNENTEMEIINDINDKLPKDLEERLDDIMEEVQSEDKMEDVMEYIKNLKMKKKKSINNDSDFKSLMKMSSLDDDEDFNSLMDD
jgi:hypothetical protein